MSTFCSYLAISYIGHALTSYVVVLQDTSIESKAEFPRTKEYPQRRVFVQKIPKSSKYRHTRFSVDIDDLLLAALIHIRRPYNLYCVGRDVKPCSISQLIHIDWLCPGRWTDLWAWIIDRQLHMSWHCVLVYLIHSLSMLCDRDRMLWTIYRHCSVTLCCR